MPHRQREMALSESEVNPAGSESPGVSPVTLTDCLQHLLKFVLDSSINSTLDFDLGLSSDVCSALLKHDHNDDTSHTQYSFDFTEGVPSYPLYKHLASALQQWIISGSSFLMCETSFFIHEEDSLKELKDRWNELVLQKGSELVNMLKRINFEFHVQEPYFTQLKDGMKTVEGRCAAGNYIRIQSGDVLFINKCLMLEVQDIHHYTSFVEMLEAETLIKVLPGIMTIEEGEVVYRKFYTKEKEQLYGVLAIAVGSPVYQPYSLLSEIISGLGYKGIQSLLGLKQTVGTIPDALPPPRSALLSSFTSPHNPNVAP